MPRIIRSALGRVIGNASHRVAGSTTAAPPVYATAFSVNATPSTAVQGATTTVTYTPLGGVWHPTEALTPTLLGLTGTFTPSILTPNSGTTASVTTTLITTSAGSGTVNAISGLGTPSTGFGIIASASGGGGSFSWPITFAGTAGAAPSGNAKLTPTPAGWVLDGSGALVMGGTVADAAGAITAPGFLGNGNQDFTFASDTPNRALTIYGVNASGDVLDFGIRADGSVLLYVVVGGVGSSAGSGAVSSVVPNTATSVGVSYSGSTFTMRVNGTNTSTAWTVSTVPGPWQLFLGNLGTTFGTKITTINSTQASQESLTIDVIGQQVSGTPFTVTGTYAIGTPTALDYSRDGGATWIAATSPTIGSGIFSFSVTATASGRLQVRDHNNTSVTATSNSFNVTIPAGSDGYANGIYYPANAYISPQAGTIPMVSGFARFSSNAPQTWWISGTDAGVGFYLAGRNGSMLFAGGSTYNNTTKSTFSIIVNVTDGILQSNGTVTGGTATYSQAVTVHNANLAAYFGGNVILDTAVQNGYNGFTDPLACRNEDTLQGIGGSLSFADTSGKLTTGGYNGWICSTPAFEPVSAHFGQITTATATVGGTAFTAPFWFAQEQPASIALRTPGTIYTYLQPGDVIGQLVAYSDTGFPPGLDSYQLTASDGTLVLTSTGQIVVAPGQSLTAGSKSMTVRVTAGSGMVTTKVIAYTVVAGTLLLPSSMTMVVNSALENWSYGQSVGTPTVSGMSPGATWTITHPDDQYGIFEMRDQPMRLFAINSSTGAITGDPGMQLPATAPNTMPGSSRQFTRPAHPIVVTATNGSVRCRQTFNVSVAWKSGPTLYVGQGMSSAHPGVGFEHLSDVARLFQNSTALPNSTYAGALILVQPNANRDYYSLHSVTNPALGETMDTDNSLRFSWNGPVCLRAANTTGARPRLGGPEFSTAGGCSIDGKSYITAHKGDFIIDGFEVSYVQAFFQPTVVQTNGVSCLRKDADVWGDYYVLNCNIHDGNNCIETGNGPFWTVVDRCVITNFGTEYASPSGATHGLYCGGCSNVVFTNNLVYHGVNGMGLKTRAIAGTVQGNRIFDGERGSLSQQIHIPYQGKYLIDNNVLQKGPNAQSCYILEYGDDTGGGIWGQLYRDNTVTISNNTVMMMVPDGNHFGNGVCFSMGGCRSAIDGSVTSITMTNNNYYLTTPNHLTKTNDPYAFAAPTIVETGAVTLSALPTISMTDPVAGFTPAARASLLLSIYDNTPSYDNYQNFWQVQMDPGQDIPLTVSHTATVGTVVANCVAATSLCFNNETPSALTAFASGTTWSIVRDPQWNGSQPWAPVGRYAIDSASGQLTVVGTPPAVGVTDFIKIRAVASGATFTCDYRFTITGT